MAAVKSFSAAAGNDEAIAGERVDDANDESCADASAIVEEAKCANKSVGETENVPASVKDCADVRDCADVKSCADVRDCADVKSCADEIANVDESGDESAVREDPVGIAHDWLGDDNVPLVPPLLHGSCTDHGST